MNSKVVYAALFALTMLIVLPVFGTVNATSTQFAGIAALVADGSPAPPPVPHPDFLVADGSPAPPPVPHPDFLVADGSPAPPPVPHPDFLVAEGSPASTPTPYALAA